MFSGGGSSPYIVSTTDRANPTDDTAHKVKIDLATADQITFSGISGALVRLKGIAVPELSTDVATKEYVDGIAEGLDIKASVRAATDAEFSGASYLGGVLTAGSNGALQIAPGSWSVGQRILVKNQTGGNATQNGIYTVTTVGVNGSAPFVLTRASDNDASEEFLGATVYVEAGGLQGTRWHCTSSIGFALDTNNVDWTQYGSSSSLSDNSVANNHLQDNAVNTNELANDAVTGLKVSATLYKTGGISIGEDAENRFHANGTTDLRLVVNDDAQLIASDGLVEVSGNLVVTGDVTGANWIASERMWKDDIEVVGAPFEKLDGLRGYTWKYKEEAPFQAGQPSAGIIADEYAAVFPDGVKFNEKFGGRVVKHEYLTALFIQALKELHARVASLEQRVAELEASKPSARAHEEFAVRVAD